VPFGRVLFDIVGDGNAGQISDPFFGAEIPHGKSINRIAQMDGGAERGKIGSPFCWLLALASDRWIAVVGRAGLIAFCLTIKYSVTFRLKILIPNSRASGIGVVQDEMPEL
jgi:hypothetical protein